MKTLAHFSTGLTTDWQMPSFAFWLVCFAWTGSSVFAQKTSLAVLTDGTRIEASLADISKSWQTTWATQGGERRLDASQLVCWGQSHAPSRRPMFVLVDGSWIVGELMRLSADEVVVRSDIFGDVKIARRSVRGAIWRPAVNPLERDEFVLRLRDDRREEDVAWLVNGDAFIGQMSASDAKADVAVAHVSVVSRPGSEPVLANVENLVAVGLRSSGETLPKQRPYGVVALQSGDVLWLRSVEFQSNASHLSLIDGTVVTIDREKLLAQIESLQLFHEQVTYLSDLPNPSYKHIPFLSLAWNYGVDRNVSRGFLRSAGNVYWKGIGMHSIARLAYELDGAYRRFESDLALDDSTGGRGSVVFRVYVERATEAAATPTWQLLYESPVVRCGDRPKPISVNIERASRLALVVDAADRGDEGDHANWLNARLIR